MNKLEQGSGDKERATTYSEKVGEIALQASEMPEFQEAVKNTKDKLEAIRNVRILLGEHFSEISNLPKPEPPKEIENAIRLRNPLGGIASNEFIIAKHIIDLLWNRK